MIRNTVRWMILNPGKTVAGVVLVIVVLFLIAGEGDKEPEVAVNPEIEQPLPQTGNSGQSPDPQPFQPPENLPPADQPGDADPAPSPDEQGLGNTAWEEGQYTDKWNADPEPPAPQPEWEQDSDLSSYLPAPSPHDSDPETLASDLDSTSLNPAVNHLPYTGRGIVEADLVNRAPDGKLVIRVIHQGTERNARAAWNRFLKRHDDPGSRYLVIYEKA